MTFNTWASKFYIYDWDSEELIDTVPNLIKANKICHAGKSERVILIKKPKASDDWDHLWLQSSAEKTWMASSPDKALESIHNKPSLINDLPVAQLEVLLTCAKFYYYNDEGASPITDEQFDKMEDKLRKDFPKSRVLKQVGAKVATKSKKNATKLSRTKVDLPYHAGSLDKRYEVDGEEGEWVISDKLDGSSLEYANLTGTHKLYTRGDGDVGQDVSHLLPFLKLPKLPKGSVIRCEAMISKEAFQQFADQFKIGRNMVSGLMNRLDGEKHPAYAHIKLVGIRVFKPKMKQSAQFAWLKQHGFETPYYEKWSGLMQDWLIKLLTKRKKESPYHIDGLVAVKNDKAYTPETSGNPKYAFAFKSNAAAVRAITAVKSVKWVLSRLGQWKPTLLLEPVQIDGRTIGKVTAHNAAYIRDNKIGPGANVTIFVSGDIIPYIETVPKKAAKPQFPAGKEGIDWKWDKTNVNLVSMHVEHDEQKSNQLLYSLKVIGVENIGLANATALVDNDLSSLESILNAKKEKIVEVLGNALGNKAQAEIKEAIDELVEDGRTDVLMIASNLFGMGFGHRKAAALLKAYPNYCTLTKQQAKALTPPAGFSSVTMKKLAEGIESFRLWASLLDIPDHALTKKVATVKLASNKLKGRKIAFTGVRDQELMDYITKNGGEVHDGVKKDTTDLIAKDPGSGSSKMQKAKAQGIKIMDLNTARKELMK